MTNTPWSNLYRDFVTGTFTKATFFARPESFKRAAWALLTSLALGLAASGAQASMDPVVQIKGTVQSFSNEYVKVKQKGGGEIYLSRNWIEKSQTIREGVAVSVKVDIRMAIAYDASLAKRFGQYK